MVYFKLIIMHTIWVGIDTRGSSIKITNIIKQQLTSARIMTKAVLIACLVYSKPGHPLNIIRRTALKHRRTWIGQVVVPHLRRLRHDAHISHDGRGPTFVQLNGPRWRRPGVNVELVVADGVRFSRVIC